MSISTHIREMTPEEKEAWCLELEYRSLWYKVQNIEGIALGDRVSYGEAFHRFKETYPNAKSWKASK